MKKILVFIILIINIALSAEKTNENWREWNITYYDYEDEENHKLVFDIFVSKLENIEKLRNYQGLKNPLVRDLSGVNTLYDVGLHLWLDYIKFSLCGAKGLDLLSDKEIELYNEIFPVLNRFSHDFFKGIYTNGSDPMDFPFLKNKTTTAGVIRSLEKMEMYIDTLLSKINHRSTN